MAADPVRAGREAHELFVEADALRAASQFRDAIDRLERALQSEGALEPSFAAEIRLRLADCHSRLNQHRQSYRAVLPLLEDPDDPVWRARALVRYAKFQFFESQFESTETACLEAIETLRPTSHHEDYGHAALWLGHARRFLGRTGEARECLLEALVSARRARSRTLEAWALNSLGHLEIQRGHLERAERLLREACAIEERLGLVHDLASARLHLAVCLYHRARWAAAREVHEAARKDYAGVGDRKGLALVGMLEARIVRLQGGDPTAILERAERDADESEYRLVKRQILEQRGLLALDRGDPQRAATYFRRILEDLIMDPPGSDLECDVRRELARALAELGDDVDAGREAGEAVRLAEEAGDRLAAAKSRVVLAGLLVGEPALDLVDEALRELTRIGAPYELARAHRAAAGILHRDRHRRAFHAAEAARIEAELGLTPPAADAAPLVPVVESPAMRRIVEEARRLGRFDGTVLIEGESGVGKERVARIIHASSPRSGEFVAVGCAGADDVGLGSELFGHVAGAFPGAGSARPGALVRAVDGTVYLERIEHLGPVVQARLLRALETRRAVPLGGVDSVPFNARVICAASVPLDGLVESGELLPDLFHRVASAVVLRVPPLRERPEDVVGLAERFLGERLSPAMRAALVERPWPGNLPQLEAALMAASFQAGVSPIRPEHLPESVGAPADRRRTLPERIEALERELIVRTLAETGGNKKRAAERLGVSRKGLIDRLKRLGLWEEHRADV